MIKVVLVDNHELVRSGVRKLFADQQDINVIAETESGSDAYKLYTKHRPDVLMMDMNMPDTSGLAALGQIMARDENARVVMFSMQDEVTFAAQAISAGAKGYVLKSGKAENVLEAVRQVANGKAYLSPDIAQKMALHNLDGYNDPTRNLTPREFEVFRLLAEGIEIEQIATMLNIGQKTVANYQTILKHKLKISTPIQLVRLALKHGVISMQLGLLPFLIMTHEI